jgi:hypothetical protein
MGVSFLYELGCHDVLVFLDMGPDRLDLIVAHEEAL